MIHPFFTSECAHIVYYYIIHDVEIMERRMQDAASVICFFVA